MRGHEQQDESRNFSALAHFMGDQVHWRGRLERMRHIADRYDSLEGVVQIDELLTGMNQMAFDYEPDEIGEVLVVEQPRNGFGYTERTYPLPMFRLDEDGFPLD